MTLLTSNESQDIVENHFNLILSSNYEKLIENILSISDDNIIYHSPKTGNYCEFIIIFASKTSSSATFNSVLIDFDTTSDKKEIKQYIENDSKFVFNKVDLSNYLNKIKLISDFF